MVKDFDFPLRKLYNSPQWLNAYPVERTALLNIIASWWLAGCPDRYPEIDKEWHDRAGLTTVQWHRVRAYVIPAMGKLFPFLKKLYDKWLIADKKKDSVRAFRRDRMLKFNAERRLKNRRDTTLTEQDTSHVDLHLPVKIAGHGENTPNSFRNRPPKPVGTLRDK